jgi:hypothetical protein
MGDEGINPYLPADKLEKVIGRHVDGDVETKQLYKEACEKYDIYHLYVNHGRTGYANSYVKSWERALDRDHFKAVRIDGIADEIVKIVTKQTGNEALKRGRIELPKLVGISW